MNTIVKAVIKKVIKLVYSELLYPYALEYVQSTENQYDDAALRFIDDLVNKILSTLN